MRELAYYLKDGLKRALEVAAIERKLIHVSSYTRGIGKTTALIEFAKEHDFYVIEPNIIVAELLQKQFDYKKICVPVYRLPAESKVVVDEVIVIEEFLKHNPTAHIITGFKTF